LRLAVRIAPRRSTFSFAVIGEYTPTDDEGDGKKGKVKKSKVWEGLVYDVEEDSEIRRRNIMV
jgi:hypothetical protein